MAVSAGASEHVQQDGVVPHVDVLIVGAGLSGIGAACMLGKYRPRASYAILEARDAIGGTWDLFRYPGIRSDSDMFTLGYSFRPWPGAKAIADGPSILEYIKATAAELGVDRAIRYRHRVVAAEWDSERARWTVTADVGDDGETVRLTCSWLSVCSGYYRYEQGHRPPLPGEERFTGELVHPQHWPPELDWTGKRVVVIGSGATAVTLVPAMSEQAAHVTMLQRTPSYVLSLPATDSSAQLLRRMLPDRVAHSILRWRNALRATAVYAFSQRRPASMRAFLRKAAIKALPAGYDVDTHFNPPYGPWDQRMCLVPDDDLFKALSSGRAEIVTDHIRTFTENGIDLESGRTLEADIVVAATGLSVLFLGGMTLTVDGTKIDPADTAIYRGMMLSGVPNLNFVFGYINNSWTLRADLINRHVVRMLDYLDSHDYDVATPERPAGAPADRPFIDLTSGYVQRGLEALPRQGTRAPWRMHHTYPKDAWLMRRGAIDGEGMTFSQVTRASDAARLTPHV